MSDPLFNLPPRRLDLSHQILGYVLIAAIIAVLFVIGWGPF